MLGPTVGGGRTPCHASAEDGTRKRASATRKRKLSARWEAILLSETRGTKQRHGRGQDARSRRWQAEGRWSSGRRVGDERDGGEKRMGLEVRDDMWVLYVDA